jgi:predicted metal-dependent peptidase
MDRLTAYRRETAFSPDILMKDATLKTDRHAGEWRAHLVRAAQGAGAAGRGVGQVVRFLAEIAVSRTPWEHHLRRLLAKAACQDPRRSYRRPRSKWIAADAEARRNNDPCPVFEPAELRNTLRPQLVIGIDASSSISTDILSVFAAEVIGITRKSNAETHVLVFDDEVFAHRRIEPPNARQAFENLPFRRDGGTSFIDVLAKADALAPSLIVVMTDLAGSFGQQPSAPVLWATTAPPDTRPPFGEVLDLSR